MARDREKEREYQRRYSQKHRKELNEKARFRYHNDEEFRERVLKYGLEYYKKNKEKFDAKMRVWRDNNRERFNQSCYASRERKAEERRRNGEKYVYYTKPKREIALKKRELRELKALEKNKKYDNGIALRRNENGIIEIQLSKGKHFIELHHGYNTTTKQYIMWCTERGKKDKTFINDKQTLENILHFIKSLETLDERRKEEENGKGND